MQDSEVLSHRSRQTISVWTLLCAQGHFHVETGKGSSPNCCHKVGSTESSRMSLYAVALRFPFTGTKGLTPGYYSSFTKLYNWHYALGQVAFSWHPPNPDFPSDSHVVKSDSSFQRIRFHCSTVQLGRALHYSSRRLALRILSLGLCACGCLAM